MTTIQFRTDKETKEQSAAIFKELGINMSDAINMFLRQSILTNGLPFQPKIPKYNAVTEAAIQEARDIIAGKIIVKTYKTVAEMNADIDAMPDEE